MDKSKVDKILRELSQNIGGDWVLLGGTLVQLQYNGERATEDIDLAFIKHPSLSKDATQNQLFQFTLKHLGMGPEFINLSVEFFLRRFAGWEAELILLQTGPKGRIFRPSLSLFCALKAERGSELDATDVLSAIRNESATNLDYSKIKKWLPPEKQVWLEQLVQKASK